MAAEASKLGYRATDTTGYERRPLHWPAAYQFPMTEREGFRNHDQAARRT
jgi:hypothetical protein